MFFSELYSAYYNAVAGILRAAAAQSVSREELRKIVLEYAFEESLLAIEPALSEEKWQLLKDGTSILSAAPQMPLTRLQKQWVNAIAQDPRIRLFTDEPVMFPEEEPLFTPGQYTVFDRYSDGDPYEEEAYRERFRLILTAIREEQLLSVTTENRKGRIAERVILPKYLEYSEKDDKFRVFTAGLPHGGTYNLARLRSCSRYQGKYRKEDLKELSTRRKRVTFELFDRRNALERVLLHFAHFEKEVEKETEEKYRVTIRYDEDDETEMVIRILSFGPMVKVTEPEEFVTLMKKRLIAQKSCGL